MIITPDAYLHITGYQIMMVCQICMLRLLHDVCTICTILSYELGTILCLILTVNMEFYFIKIITCEFVFWHLCIGIHCISSHFCWHYILGFFPCPHISFVCLFHKFVVLLQFAAVSSSWTGKWDWNLEPHLSVEIVKFLQLPNPY